METAHRYQRPPFEDALQAWKALLTKHGLSTDIVWILDENLCFERAPETAAAKATYHHFAELDARMVFYRLGTSRGRSICIQLCDPWFEPKNEAEGYVRRDEWLISFYPGAREEIEEITDPKRWQQRVVRGRPLSAVDFCMTLSALRELKAHGRVLTPDERFGLKILRSMQR